MINKLTIFHIPASGVVASVQIMACIFVQAALHLLSGTIKIEPPTREILGPYLLYSILFALSMFTNMRALDHSNVETVIVFRNATPIAVTFCDAIFLGREHPTLRSIGGIGLIFA